ncbi:MAG: hypothetical protein J5944_13010 [Lentisphaeria bacterium]|nr:hypothetical protein [Lentisphaeria bacterium]
MKDDEITARAMELAVLFADIPDDVLMRFVNRSTIVCTEFDRSSILRALARKSNSGREQLKAFLFKPVPDSLLKKPSWSWGTSLKSRYEKNVTCEGLCRFDTPLPKNNPEHDDEFVENAKELLRRDRELLKKLQQKDESIIRREILEEAEFNTAFGDSEAARAEAAFRDGVVRAKLAELERYVKEQMAELRRENRAYMESLRQEFLQSCPDQGLPAESCSAGNGS